jgi:DUF1009 family protein
MGKIAIISGSGKLPEAIAKELIKQKKDIYIIGLKNFANPSLKDFSANYFEVRLGQVKKMIDILMENQIKKVILAGKVEHINIFKDIKPDKYAFLLIKKLKSKNSSSIFDTIKDYLKTFSIELLRYDQILSDIIPNEKTVVGKRGKDLKKDIEFGYKIAKEIAKMGIGQSIAIRDGVILAVEGIEGTDRMIERAGKYAKDFIIVKVSMPEQDMRFDIPVVGMETVKNIKKNGGKGLAIEAKKTIILDFNDVMEYCKQSKLILVAI